MIYYAMQVVPQGCHDPQFGHSSLLRSLQYAAFCSTSSPLLDLRAAQGRVDALVHQVPIDLIEHLVDVALLRHQEGTLSEGYRLEHLNCEPAGAHLGSEPHPALAIILHLLCLVDAIADTALADEHRVLHLRLEALHANLDVLLADGAGGRALPQARVPLEALLRELAIEELHDELSDDGALGWVAAAAGDRLSVERLDVRIADLVLATAGLQCYGALLTQARRRLQRRRRGRGDEGQQQLRGVAGRHQEERGRQQSARRARHLQARTLRFGASAQGNRDQKTAL